MSDTHSPSPSCPACLIPASNARGEHKLTDLLAIAKDGAAENLFSSDRPSRRSRPAGAGACPAISGRIVR